MPDANVNHELLDDFVRKSSMEFSKICEHNAQILSILQPTSPLVLTMMSVIHLHHALLKTFEIGGENMVPTRDAYLKALREKA